MSVLNITKEKEAAAIANIWNMGVMSLNPASYTDLERILGELCEARNIDFGLVGDAHKSLTCRDEHYSDCTSNNAPAMLPAPCDCKYR